MKVTKFIILFFISLSINLSAQKEAFNFDKEFLKAEKYFPNVNNLKPFERDEKAKQALPIYLQLLKTDSSNYNLMYRIGVCYLNDRTRQFMALTYLESAAKSININYNATSPQEKNAPVIVYKFLGDAYHLAYRFDEAIEVYNKYLEQGYANKQAMINEVNRKIEICKNAKQQVADPVNVKIENLGTAINTTFPDYSPIVSADETMMIFTSRRAGSVGERKDEYGNYFEDIYISRKNKNGEWQKAENIGAEINTEVNEASVGFSADGQQILIYKDDNGDGNIYTTTLKGDKWAKPVKLNSNINSKYWETTACLSPDGNTLYFVSDRPGGFGGRDIYKSTKNKDGDWGVPVNLGGAINTIYEEDAPFIHPDGITLYFSSTGHNTMGGFDVFYSVLNSADKWSQPVNIGYPVNTTDNDIYFAISPDKKNGYYSSANEQGIGEKDNYIVHFLDEQECSPIAIYKGVVADSFGVVLKNAEITVKDIETGSLVGVYRINEQTGRYLFVLTSGRNYSICYSANGHMFCSVNKDMRENKIYCPVDDVVQLPPIKIGSKIVLKNILFDFDKSTLRPVSVVELEKLLSFLNQNPSLVVEISGHTDSKGNAKHNKELSEARAKAVVDYLVKKGISAKRLKAKGYGPDEPVAPNQNKDGSDNPEGRQLNRRVELKVIGM